MRANEERKASARIRLSAVIPSYLRLLIIMKFFTLASVLFAAATALAAPSANTATVSYDQTYDVASNSLDIVACSDGPNGLETKGELPAFEAISCN